MTYTALPYAQRLDAPLVPDGVLERVEPGVVEVAEPPVCGVVNPDLIPESAHQM